MKKAYKNVQEGIKDGHLPIHPVKATKSAFLVSAEDHEIFFGALLRPPTANKALKAAAQRYRLLAN